jgi:outer membrane lipoprotein carrier protein
MAHPGAFGLRAVTVSAWILCLVQLGVCGAAAAAPGLTLTREALVARIQSRYDRTTHLHARFRQETRLHGFDQAQIGAGEVWILKPGRMRWDYLQPERQTIIAAGDTLWIYLPEDRQAIRDHLDRSLGTRTPALFLAGEAQLSELFTVVGTSTQDPSEGGFVQLELMPKQGTFPYTQVQLGVDLSSYLVTLVRMTDALGNVTTMWFSDIDTEGAVAPSLFQFQAPPGVDVISPPTFPVPR